MVEAALVGVGVILIGLGARSLSGELLVMVPGSLQSHGVAR